MKDRLSANPGRVLITSEDGGSYYATMTRADNPTQDGTPLSKDTLLSDSAVNTLGLTSSDPTVNEALRKIGTAMTVETVRSICT